jgi:hypothetical protein
VNQAPYDAELLLFSTEIHTFGPKKRKKKHTQVCTLIREWMQNANELEKAKNRKVMERESMIVVVKEDELQKSGGRKSSKTRPERYTQAVLTDLASPLLTWNRAITLCIYIGSDAWKCI